ncbi:hypothetical protein N752_14185 [Desulforamulus aquiferis]|nr:hypothetical protein N752_14185 [Desulforamulus aquiferis]
MMILAVNPGSTSTKIAAFNDELCLWKKTIEHPTYEISSFNRVSQQYNYRVKAILEILGEMACQLNEFDAMVGRGGLLKPIPGGTYLVDEELVEELHDPPGGEHASNLGGVIAYYLAKQVNIPAYIVDPVSVDELDPVARLSGHPELPRTSLSHALNMKAVARKVAEEIGSTYEQVNLILAHLAVDFLLPPTEREK